MSNFDIKAVIREVARLPREDALKVIEEERARVQPAFDYMVELNKLAYDIRYPGEAERLGLK